MINLVFHVFVTSLNSYAIWYDQKYIDVPFSRAKAFLHFPLKGRSTFFTTWSFIAQILYFSLAIANDLIGTDDPFPTPTPLIRSMRDIVFAAFAFPAAMYVTTVFWTIYTLNRELIMPKKTDKVIPSWFNHLLHTTVLIFMLIEMCLTPHNYPSKKIGTFLVASFSCAYFIWMMYVYYDTKTWVYPLFDVLNIPLRFGYCLGTVILSIALYHLGEMLNSTIWSNGILQSKIF